MLYSYLADLIVMVHFGFILLVIFGGLLAFYRIKLIWLHLPALIWGVLIEFSGWICPLTPLENKFRTLAYRQGYEEGFIEHYILPVIYPDGLTRNLQIILGVLVLAVNLVVYTILFHKRQKRAHR